MHRPRNPRNEAGWLSDFQSESFPPYDTSTNSARTARQERQLSQSERHPAQPVDTPPDSAYAPPRSRSYMDGHYTETRGFGDVAIGSSQTQNSLRNEWGESRYVRDVMDPVDHWNYPSGSSYTADRTQESYMGTDERSRKPIASTSNQGYFSYYGQNRPDSVTSNMDALGARVPRSEGPVAPATSTGSAEYPLNTIAYPAPRNYTTFIPTHSPASGSRYSFDRSMPGLQGENSNLPPYSPGARGDDGQRAVEVSHSRRPPFVLEHESQAEKQTAIRRNNDVSPEHKRPRIVSNVISTGTNRPAPTNDAQQSGQGPQDDYKQSSERRRRSSAGGSHGRGRSMRPTPGLVYEPDGDRPRSDDVGTSADQGGAATQPLTNSGGRALKRTYQACIRCRKKKLKCDSALPRCTPCQTTNSECHQADVRRQTSYPRGYVEDLEARCQAAEQLLFKILPGIHPKEFPALLDNSIVISPAQIQNANSNANLEAEQQRRLISKETPSMPTPDSLRHLMNEDTIATYSLDNFQGSSGTQAEATRYSSVMDKVITIPSEVTASRPGDDAFSHWSSSAHPVINEFCNLKDKEATDKLFKMTPTEYETIALQLGYGHLDADSTLNTTPDDNTTSRESSLSSSDFWTRRMKAEDQVREREERTATDLGWSFPPGDREMARRVIDKFFDGIHRYRPFMDEDAFKREYGRLSKANISFEGGFDPRFIACAHLVLALGTTLMDMEARQTKSALTEVPTGALPIPVRREPGYSSRPQEQPVPTTLPCAAAMLDRPLPANGLVFPLGHSTLFEHLDVHANTDGIGKVSDAWPSASYFFQQGIRVSKGGSSNSLQDLQKMIMVYTWYSCKVPVRALWRLMCNIVTMCLQLRLHEDPGKRGIAGREAELNKQLFWTCFKLDQNLASLLGHNPFLKISDVSCPTPSVQPHGSLIVWPALSELSVIKAEILAKMYQPGRPPEHTVTTDHQLIRRLETFFNSLPSRCRDLQRVWTNKTNILGRGDDTYTQETFGPEEVVDTAHVMLEYYTTYNLCVRPVFMNMDVREEVRNQAMSQAMIASRSAIVAHVHLSHVASTFIITLPCNLFLDTLVLLNGATRGLKALSLDEVQTVTRKAIQMLWDPRWSTESRPMADTAKTLQIFHEECFGKPSDGSENGHHGILQEHQSESVE